MKKDDKRGFVLAETIAISTVVIIALIVIYAQFVNINNSYYKSFTYNNVNKLYLVNHVKEFIISDTSSSIYGNLTDDNPYIDITSCENYFIESLQCKNLMTAIDAKQVLVTTMDTTKLLEIFKDRTNISENMYSYIKNSKSKEYGYRIIVEFNDGNIAGLTTKAEVPLKSYYVADVVKLTTGNDTTSAWYVIEDSNSTKDTVKLLKATNIDDNTYPFDEENHRLTENNSYCIRPDLGCNAYAANGTTVTEDSSIKINVDNYANNLNLGSSLKEARLINLSELVDLGCEEPRPITSIDDVIIACKNSNYSWISTANGYWTMILYVEDTVTIYAVMEDKDYDGPDASMADYGIRPVIVVSKSVVGEI